MCSLPSSYTPLVTHNSTSCPNSPLPTDAPSSQTRFCLLGMAFSFFVSFLVPRLDSNVYLLHVGSLAPDPWNPPTQSMEVSRLHSYGSNLAHHCLHKVLSEHRHLIHLHIVYSSFLLWQWTWIVATGLVQQAKRTYSLSNPWQEVCWPLP